MTVVARAHDLLVNTDLGDTKQPEWMVRVKEDYFKAGESMFTSRELPELLDEMDAMGVERAVLMTNLTRSTDRVLSFVDARPDRFSLGLGGHDLLRPMPSLRALESFVRDHPVAYATIGPSFWGDGMYPPSDAVYYPLYTKCCELDLPLCINTGLPGPPIPGEVQNPIHLDRVCVRFPELKLCMMHGADPWWDVAIRLMIKYANLRLMTSAWSPRHLPEALLHFMSTRGKHRVMFASDSPVLSITRCVTEAAALELSPEVLDAYLYQNAQDFFFRVNALSDRLAAVAAIDPAAPAVEFEGEWATWGDLDHTATEVARVLAQVGLGAGAPVGVLLRNRPAALGAFLGLLRAEACVVTLSPLLGAERIGRDVVELALPLVIGERADLDLLPPGSSSASVARAELGSLGGPIELTLPQSGAPAWDAAPGVALRMLTSGTTGPPKRIDLRYEVLEQVMAGAKHYETGTGTELRLRDGVVVVNAPLVHVSGVFRVVQAVLDGRRIALLERFTVEGWSDAVRRHRPKTVSLVPAALSMVLDADVDVDVFDSIRSVVSGTAPLDPALAEAFTARYGVPVLTSYGATEFGGGVAGWNFADHQRFGVEKRGSVGRAHAGCALRVVDAHRGTVLGPDEVGILEVHAAQLGGAGWVRTTDLARLDADGFLWIVGRADQTILRGGFKVQPEVVRAALERDPGVTEAAVIGIPDRRLGAVPVALVEGRDGHDIDVDVLLAGAAEQLAPYEMPVTVTVVDALPRVESGKVDLAAVREHVQRLEASPGE